ncbi:MAG: Stf0 family sulfotransferase [Proteobacteria bacterium]|nr:hypothetical protein [Luminiphilus sp.]MDA0649854.1 Stf0 family sulfotransferase [Pseudomonadota bacterium]
MDTAFLQSLNIDQYPVDPHYARELRKIFGERFLRELSDEEKAELGEVTFAPLLFGNRSGSNLLTNCLHRAGLGFPEHGEPMNIPSIERIAERHALNSLTDYALFLARRWRQHQVIGFKINIEQLFDLTRTGLLNHFKDIKLLHSVRRDRLAQAVSHYIAKSSGSWSTQEEVSQPITPAFSAPDILQFLRRGARLEADYQLYKTIHGVAGIEVWYEDLVSDPKKTIETIGNFLNCATDLSKVDLATALTQPQNRQLNQEFAERFRSELRMTN